jgi:hypothetical protein
MMFLNWDAAVACAALAAVGCLLIALATLERQVRAREVLQPRYQCVPGITNDCIQPTAGRSSARGRFAPPLSRAGVPRGTGASQQQPSAARPPQPPLGPHTRSHESHGAVCRSHLLPCHAEQGRGGTGAAATDDGRGRGEAAAPGGARACWGCRCGGALGGQVLIAAATGLMQVLPPCARGAVNAPRVCPVHAHVWWED